MVLIECKALLSVSECPEVCKLTVAWKNRLWKRLGNTETITSERRGKVKYYYKEMSQPDIRLPEITLNWSRKHWRIHVPGVNKHYIFTKLETFFVSIWNVRFRFFRSFDHFNFSRARFSFVFHLILYKILSCFKGKGSIIMLIIYIFSSLK